MHRLSRSWNLCVCLMVRGYIKHQILRSLNCAEVGWRLPHSHGWKNTQPCHTFRWQSNQRKDPDCHSPRPALQQLSPRTVPPSPRKTGRKECSQPSNQRCLLRKLVRSHPRSGRSGAVIKSVWSLLKSGRVVPPHHPLSQSKVCRLAKEQVYFFLVTDSSARRLRNVTDGLISITVIRAGAGIGTTWLLCWPGTRMRTWGYSHNPVLWVISEISQDNSGSNEINLTHVTWRLL